MSVIRNLVRKIIEIFKVCPLPLPNFPTYPQSLPWLTTAVLNESNRNKHEIIAAQSIIKAMCALCMSHFYADEGFFNSHMLDVF